MGMGGVCGQKERYMLASPSSLRIACCITTNGYVLNSKFQVVKVKE